MNRHAPLGALVLAACGGRLAPDDSPAIRCAPATHLEGFACVPDDAGLDIADSSSPTDSSPPPPLADAGAPDATPRDADAATDAPPSPFPLDSTPCLHGGNIIYYDGDPGDPVYAGKVSFTSGPWATLVLGDLVQVGSGGNAAAVQVINDYLAAGQEFDVSGLSPGLVAAVSHTDCEAAAGRVRIDELESADAGVSDLVLVRFTMAFARRCPGSSTVMRGCVHYER